MPTAFTMGVRARLLAAAAPPPPSAPAGQLTQTAWRGGSQLAANAGGLGNNELAYNLGLLDIRADTDSRITTANGPVSTVTSGQGIAGTFTQAVAANQPSHSAADDWIAFASAAANDPDGDFLTNANIRDRYRTTSNALGAFYVLFQVAALPSATSTIIRVGAASGTYTAIGQRAYRLYVNSSNQLSVMRGGNVSGDNKTAPLTAAPIAANEWIAAGFVLNDSRASGTVNGTPDQITRLFVKTRAGGSFPAMQTVATAVQSTAADGSLQVEIGRARQNTTGISECFNGLRLHSLGFDGNPPITDAGIEQQLDKLLARV